MKPNLVSHSLFGFPAHPNHSSPRRLAGEKKSYSYNHKTTIWVSHEYYLNPKFFKILSRAFWVIAILVFSPYGARVDFKALTECAPDIQAYFPEKLNSWKNNQLESQTQNWQHFLSRCHTKKDKNQVFLLKGWF